MTCCTANFIFLSIHSAFSSRINVKRFSRQSVRGDTAEWSTLAMRATGRCTGNLDSVLAEISKVSLESAVFALVRGISFC